MRAKILIIIFLIFSSLFAIGLIDKEAFDTNIFNGGNIKGNVTIEDEKALRLRDATSYINSLSDGALDIYGETGINLTGGKINIKSSDGKDIFIHNTDSDTISNIHINASNAVSSGDGGSIRIYGGDGSGFGSQGGMVRIAGGAQDVGSLVFQGVILGTDAVPFTAGRGSLYVSDDSQFDGLVKIDRGLRVNDDSGSGGSDDFIVEGNTLTSLIHADSSADKVGINQATPKFMLHLKQTASAISGNYVDVSNLGFQIQRASDATGQAAGLGMGVSSGTENVGGAIIVKRTGSEGIADLHFAVKNQSTSGYDIPIRMTIEQHGNITLGTDSWPGYLKIRDTDNAGWSCCTTLDGTMSCVTC